MENIPRKQEKKAIHLLNQFIQITSTNVSQLLSTKPTIYLLFTNVGYTGNPGSVNTNELKELIQDYSYQQIIMPLFIPISILVFTSVQESHRAYEALQHSYHFSRPLILEFIQFIPLNLYPIMTHPKDKKILGLDLQEEFISREMENLIYNWLKDRHPKEWGRLNQRRILHYGYRFNYNNFTFEPIINPLPPWTEGLFKQMQKQILNFKIPNQLTVNLYSAGDGIAPHKDNFHGYQVEPIYTISLLSSIVMEFKREFSYHVDLPPRSLLTMDSIALTEYEHGIRPRKVDNIHGQIRLRRDRISLTFRYLVPSV